MIGAHEATAVPPKAASTASRPFASMFADPIDIPFDGIAGMGIRVEPWYAANGQRFIGLAFTSALNEQAHDLTPGQALAPRDALTSLANSLG